MRQFQKKSSDKTYCLVLGEIINQLIHPAVLTYDYVTSSNLNLR